MWLLIYYSSLGSRPQCPLRASPAVRPPGARSRRISGTLKRAEVGSGCSSPASSSLMRACHVPERESVLVSRSIFPGSGGLEDRERGSRSGGQRSPAPHPLAGAKGMAIPGGAGRGSLGQGFRSRDISKKDLGLARRRGAGFSYRAEGAELPQARRGSAGAPSPGRGQQGSPAHPSAEAARPTPWSGSPSPAPGRGAEASAGARQLGAPPHCRTASRVWVAGRGGRRGADVAARPAAGEAGRRLPARPSPARSCGGPVAAAAALGAGS